MEDKIEGTSFGSSPILEAINTIELKSKKYNVFLISIETLIRNILADDNTISIEVTYEKINMEMKIFDFYIREYSKATANTEVNVVYYLSDYKSTLSNLRPLNKAKTLIKKHLDYSLIRLGDRVFNIKDSPNLGLFSLIKSLKTRAVLKTLLITTNIIDYHLIHFLPKLEIILSFTGKILLNTDLSTKVFGNNLLRFNKYSHFLLGDKNNILPNVKRSRKKELLELAETGNWKLLTESALRKKLIVNKFIDNNFQFKVC